MKVVFRNANLVFEKPVVDVSTFSISYADLVNYNLNGDVNLLYQGDIFLGDSVEIKFDYPSNSSTRHVIMTSQSGTYGDNKGLGTLRLVQDQTTITATATGNCKNLKVFVSDKSTEYGGTNYETHGFTGTVTIRRA